MCRYLAKVGDRDFVATWGSRMFSRDDDFREDVRRLLNSRDSGIRNELARHFMTLESGGESELGPAFEKCKAALRLKDGIDPFDTFADLDESVPVTPNDDDDNDD